jgi:hypothetical protein
MFPCGDPLEHVQLLLDHHTGLPQHSYEFDQVQRYGAVEQIAWMGMGPHDKRLPDEKPELCWGAVKKRAANLGHNQYP